MNRRVKDVIAASLGGHLALAALLPLSGDESYHWWWAMHPALSYQEHPPLQAYLIRLCVALLGHHPVAVRLPALLSGVAVALLLVKILLRLHESRTAPAAPAGFALLLNLMPLYFFLAAYANNDMLFYAFSLAALYGAWRLGDPPGEGSGERWAPWIGPLLALALLAKLIALLLLPAAAFALARRPGRLPARFWAGLAAGVMLLAPFVIWNYSYGWPALGIRLGHKTTEFIPLQFPLELLGPELLGVTPLALGAAFWFAARGSRWTASGNVWRLAGLLLLVPYHLMALWQHVEPHWPFLGFLLLLPAVWSGWPGGRRALLYSAAACTAGLALFTALTLGQLSSWNYPLRKSRFEATHIATQFIGWPELQGRLRAESAQLKPGGFLMAEGYGTLTQGLFLLEGKREGFLVENPVRSGGSIAYFETAHPPGPDADGLFFAEAGSPSHPEIRRKLALLFTAVEPADDLVIRHGTICRRFIFIRLRGFRGFAKRREFYSPENYLGEFRGQSSAAHPDPGAARPSP
jgi:hypothetical protein